MKNITRKLGCLLLALALSVSLAVPALAAEEAPSSPGAAAMAYGKASQIAWAVWKDGEIVESGREGGVREDPDAGHLAGLAAFAAGSNAVYGVGSVSKIYTTVAVMQLAERGKLDLDKPVTTYLPAFRMADPRYQDITVRMLLNHSSGLMGSSLTSALLFNDASTVAADTLLDVLAGQRLKADPGAYSVYCNDGFTLAQLVVEAASGQDFEDYLRANVLDPAGLEATYFPREVVSGKAAEGVVVTYQGEDVHPTPVDCLGTVGTGGIFATAEDLASFGGALTGETLLTKASLDAMAAPEYQKGLWPEGGPDALAFGLGWDNVEWFPFSQSGITALAKGGDTQYYHAGLVVLPEYKMAAAVLSSGGVSTLNQMAASQLLIQALEEQGVKVDQSPLTLSEAKPAAMPKELTKYTGYYGSLYTYRMRVTEDGKAAMHYLNMAGAPDQVFTYYSDGSFRNENNTAAIRFVEEDNGQTYLKQWAYSNYPGLGGNPMCNYAAMKLPERQIPKELQELWDKRMSETVLVPMKERYSSQVYPALAATFAADVLVRAAGGLESAPGYTGSLEIVDETHARYVPQIPGTAGRDGYDLEFRRDEKGVLWMFQSDGSVGMDIRGIPNLSAGKGRAVSTIQPDGYVRWYRVDEKTAGKTMTVQVPEDAGFWVFHATGVVSVSPVVGSASAAKLEEGDLIVFAGNPGARFDLTFT